MKKLTRMKLINWHRFNNCTIDFGDSTLLSGENGAGKSTLLEAIRKLYQERDKYIAAMSAGKNLNSIQHIVKLIDECARS